MSEHTPTPWSASNQYLYGVDDRPLAIASGKKEWATDSGGLCHAEACANAAFIVHAVNSIARITAERDALRSVAWAAQGLLSADEIVHPTLSRTDAVAQADKKLRQELGKWQMEYTAASSKISVTSDDGVSA